MIRKRALEILLSKMEDIPDPRPDLEQYRTPPGIVAEIALKAFSNGSVEGKSILEPGCGGAPFLIAAGALGATHLAGIDVDPRSIGAARRNLARAGAEIGCDLNGMTELVEADVSGFALDGRYDTVFMNPPFGAQRKGADRPFLDLAASTAGEIYSLHNASGIGFVRGYMADKGFEIDSEEVYRFPVPRRFAFHTRESADIEVVLLHLRPA